MYINFDSMFHVAIENTSIHNYFSEKLLDCFQTKTVPIYYGCRNIDKYFNVKGIIQAFSLEEIISKCNEVNETMYHKMQPFLDENYERSMAWLDPKEQVETAIKKLLAEI